MALTPEQLEARKRYIGSSDMASILGLNPHASAYDIWLEKSGKLETWKGNEATEAGVWLEPVVCQWAMHRLGVPLTAGEMYVHSNGLMCANLDAETPDGHPVECKTSGIVGPIYGNWGTPGTDEVPETHIIQVMHQMACHPKKPGRGYVAALLGGCGFCIYQIERNEELIAALEQKAAQFWNEHVLTNLPPPNSMPSLEVARRIRRQAGVIAPLAENICDELLAAVDARKQAEAAEDQVKARVLAMIDGADAVRRGMDGSIIATNNQDKRGIRSFRLKGAA